MRVVKKKTKYDKRYYVLLSCASFIRLSPRHSDCDAAYQHIIYRKWHVTVQVFRQLSKAKFLNKNKNKKFWQYFEKLMLPNKFSDLL